MHISHQTLQQADGVSQLSWLTGDQKQLTLFHARFDVHHFDPAHFSRAGIIRPAHIARSVMKRQAEFFFGRACAMAALRHLGMSGIQVEVGTGREPIWPAEVSGSISHCRTMAAAMVLPERGHAGVGIDIEEVISEPSRLEALIGTVVFPPELSYLGQLHIGWDRNVLLTLIFSAKESFFKGAYRRVRRIFDFDAVELAGIDRARRTMAFMVRDNLCDEFRRGQIVEVHFTMFDDRHVLTAFLA